MKSILHVCTAPPPALHGADAMYQDIQRLIDRFGGRVISVFPFKKPSRFVPHWLMGVRNRGALREAMTQASLIHVHSATLKPLPCIASFDGPVVYTVTASAGQHVQADWFNRHRVSVVVNNARDEQRLRASGLTRVVNIPPGMELLHLCYSPPPASPFTLLVGSAPWTRAQFRTKGIDVLLESLEQMPDLKLVLLWRQLWHDELMRKLQRKNLASRVVVHNQWMNVNDVLADCHAAVVLAEHERLVKAWPHSAIESIAAGKPVLLSRCIAMSDFVEEHRAGLAVESLDTHDIVSAIQTLKTTIDRFSGERLRALAQQQFDHTRMIQAYAKLYETD